MAQRRGHIVDITPLSCKYKLALFSIFLTHLMQYPFFPELLYIHPQNMLYSDKFHANRKTLRNDDGHV